MSVIDPEEIRTAVLATLDELATFWVVEGPESLTEQRLLQLAREAAKAPQLESFARYCEHLANQLPGVGVLADEPFTALRSQLDMAVSASEPVQARSQQKESKAPAAKKRGGGKSGVAKKVSTPIVLPLEDHAPAMVLEEPVLPNASIA